MSEEALKASIVRKALDLCIERQRNHCTVATPAILDSIKIQLEWLVGFFEGKNNERQRLRDLTFGHYAAREMDERDQEFTDALYKAYYVASQTTKGLKLDTKVLNNDS